MTTARVESLNFVKTFPSAAESQNSVKHSLLRGGKEGCLRHDIMITPRAEMQKWNFVKIFPSRVLVKAESSEFLRQLLVLYA